MKKNIISIMLAIVMVLGMFSITAFAEEATLIASEPKNINTEAKTMDVTQPSELLWVTEHSANAKRTDIPKTFSGWTINITNDITWSGEWAPITNFHGKMIGATNEAETDYITISGLHVTTASSNAALCGNVKYDEGNGAPTFKNIKIADSEFRTNGNYAGAFVGNGYTATFTNCHVFDCIIYGYRFVGGIAGTTYGNITNCTVKGTTKNDMVIEASAGGNVLNKQGDNVGGIVGLVGEGNTTLSGCYVESVTVKGTRQIGGIAGLAQYGNIINNCHVSDSTLYASASYDMPFLKVTAAVGGILGQIDPGSSGMITIENSSVAANVSISRANGTHYCGWVIGDVTRGSNGYTLINVDYPEEDTSIPEIGA